MVHNNLETKNKGRTKEKRGRRGVVSECVRTVGEIVGN